MVTPRDTSSGDTTAADAGAGAAVRPTHAATAAMTADALVPPGLRRAAAESSGDGEWAGARRRGMMRRTGLSSLCYGEVAAN
ncbi:hypothetical protein GCM10023191_083390 [Actinoallomurus oryzae]|uniref:Uncharacterized protein n=1 Tax=Actinoallomurus oryzae TaxID=502180 RepID=A0ABP8R0H1_9ACTN